MSFIVAGFACVLSAFCYAEYACEFPVAGGAFNYVTLTFGEFVGWLTACQLFVEWTLANAAVAKGFSSYFCSLFDIRLSIFQIYTDSYLSVEWLSILMVSFLTIVMLLGSRESAIVQNCSMTIYLVAILFIIIAGATKVDSSNYKPYTPYSASGVFAGASNVFFSFIGFDMVASMSEESRNPHRDLPIAIVGSLGIATAIYVGMSTVIVGMVKYTDYGLSNAGFSYVFKYHGMSWAARIVAVAAVLGCLQSEFGGLVGQSRIFVTMSRAGLLPRFLSRIHPKIGVPHWACFMSGLIAAALAFFLNLNLLMDFVSMGTLFAYMIVCIGILYRHYYIMNPAEREARLQDPINHARLGRFFGVVTTHWPITIRVVVNFVSGLISGLMYARGSPTQLDVMYAFLAVGGTTILSFFLLRDILVTNNYRVPLMPIIPAGGMFINSFLIGMLPKKAWYFWLCFTFVGVLIYFFYGIHHTQGEGRGTRPLIPVVDKMGFEEKEDPREIEPNHEGESEVQVEMVKSADHTKAM
mmetsp:Transcript_7631/g.14970  ORF Transcript_7631/g.14970 Transcript_7631/m.14970 type:complete len:524 (-) Transcript_7631:138-1709(-)|eukprot:CAMPEP_0175043516 /NCGR_PEP_ID=MMETSP0052_2-20121109/3236_1 /TAXON_ID=51329 ORGANISM="Polytomella parva, Strain SAG 63-3" /NCGR_SAMPLE_ID=MMETSP0052_2 /ASSEMBLY_ACC=CAM_ASM_000194 /LENGTH=523 /DNA_ID=CAMNT_0016306595 /DNA_START=885 /DNA_END=2456 /DNA_ORIENTATION=+